MKRFRELVTEVRTQFSEDPFFSDFEELLKDQGKRRHYRAYNDALTLLDDDSWAVLKAKAVKQFKSERVGQLKEGFFNHLNEAFAYRYLIRKGFSNVRILAEGRRKRPDLSYSDHGTLCHCEVKTLGITKAEIERRDCGKAFDLTIYRDLGEGFEKKLLGAVKKAWVQVHAAGRDGLVFILVRPDDIAQDHHQRHRKQLAALHKKHGLTGVVLKFDHIRNRRMTFPRKG